MIRPVRLLNLGLLAVLVAASAVVYPRLPERFPVHFDLQGHPNRWARGGALEWFILPAAALLAVALLTLVGQLCLRRPELVNVPDRERLLRLPPDRREAVLRLVSDWLDGMGTLLLGLFGVIQAGIYAAARGREVGPLFAVGTGVVSLLVPISVIVMTLRVSRRIDAEARAVAASGSGGGSPRDGR